MWETHTVAVTNDVAIVAACAAIIIIIIVIVIVVIVHVILAVVVVTMNAIDVEGLVLHIRLIVLHISDMWVIWMMSV